VGTATPAHCADPRIPQKRPKKSGEKHSTQPVLVRCPERGEREAHHHPRLPREAPPPVQSLIRRSALVPTGRGDTEPPPAPLEPGTSDAFSTRAR
jgi:hypothetical protein